MSKKIFVHDTVVNPLGQRGVDRCYHAYAQALADTYSDRVRIYSFRPAKFEGTKTILWPSARVRPKILGNRLKWLSDLYGSILADASSDIYYSAYYGRVQTKIPQVFSAYDMIYEKFPQFFPLSDRSIRQQIDEKKACFERASLLICISQSTANDILERYPSISQERLQVVHLGVDDLFLQPARPEFHGKPYFLYVGRRARYKNFTRFLNAFGISGLSSKFDLRIISPMQIDFTETERELISRYRLEDCIQVSYAIADEELKKYYAGAHAFVYPTEYEGFGLPVIEALASGTLVLASNTSSVPEAGGAAPFYFDPTSIDSIVGTLQAVAQISDSTRKEHILAGKAWAAQFTWRNSQQAFLRALQQLL